MVNTKSIASFSFLDITLFACEMTLFAFEASEDKAIVCTHTADAPNPLDLFLFKICTLFGPPGELLFLRRSNVVIVLLIRTVEF